MGRNEGGEGAPGRELSPQEVNAHLEKVGRERFSYELGILAQEPFRAAGPEAKAAGWGGLELRAVMAGLLAEKIANLMGLPEDEKKALISAAVLVSPMRRVQYERLAAEKRSVETLTSKERIALDDEGAEHLKKLGVPEFVVRLTEANNPRFAIHVGGGHPTGEDPRVERLQKLLLLVHDTVNQERLASPDGGTLWKTDISDWRGRLAEAGRTYKTLGAESFKDVHGNSKTYFELEAQVLEDAEKDVRTTTKKTQKTLKPKDNQPLAEFLREEVMRDIAAGIAAG